MPPVAPLFIWSGSIIRIEPVLMHLLKGTQPLRDGVHENASVFAKYRLSLAARFPNGGKELVAFYAFQALER
jgi:hypothetical protein